MISVGMITYIALVFPTWIPAATKLHFYLKLVLLNNLDLEIPKHFVKLLQEDGLKNSWFKIFSAQIKFCF